MTTAMRPDFGINEINARAWRVITLVKALTSAPPPRPGYRRPLAGDLVTFTFRGEPLHAIVLDVAVRQGVEQASLAYLTDAMLRDAQRDYHRHPIDPRGNNAPRQAAEAARTAVLLVPGSREHVQQAAYRNAYTDMLIRNVIANALPGQYWAARVDLRSTTKPLSEITVVNRGV